MLACAHKGGLSVHSRYPKTAIAAQGHTKHVHAAATVHFHHFRQLQTRRRHETLQRFFATRLLDVRDWRNMKWHSSSARLEKTHSRLPSIRDHALTSNASESVRTTVKVMRKYVMPLNLDNMQQSGYCVRNGSCRDSSTPTMAARHLSPLRKLPIFRPQPGEF